jgi:hypothetical protein
MARKLWQIPLYGSGHPPKYAIVDEQDYKALHMHKWRITKDGYAYRFASHGPIKLHSEICPAPKGLIVDHKNRNPLDCRRTNLRVVTKQQSEWNKGPYRTNTSGYKGVSFDTHRNLWASWITANGKRRFLGRFSTAKQAARAYDSAAQQLHGQFAYLNFPKR